MQHADFLIEFVDFQRDSADLRRVREPVFIVEQAVPPALEWDELDAVSIHAIAREPDGTPIGTARLTPEHSIGRMAVLAPWRGRGVGAALLEALIERARELDYPALELHAQTHAIGFYEGFGFTAFGGEYEEAGIPHRSMRLALAGAPDERALRETETQHEAAALTLEVIRRGRRSLALYTRDLDPALLGSSEAVEALRSFATSTRGALVRVLVHDLRRAVREGHGLISLAQRLPSRFSIRVVVEEPDVQYAAAFAINDQGGYVFRPIATRNEASACLHGPARQRQLLAHFNETWERARPATELRPL